MVPIRKDYSATELRRLAKSARTAAASRRLLALALVLEGAKRAEAAKAGGMDRQSYAQQLFAAEGFIVSMPRVLKVFTAGSVQAQPAV